MEAIRLLLDDPHRLRFEKGLFNGLLSIERLLVQRLGKGTFSRDGKTFILDARQQFHVFDIPSGQDLFQLTNQEGQQNSLVMSPDGRLLLTAAMSSPQKKHVVSLWELATRQVRKEVEMPSGGTGGVAFSLDGKLFVAAAGDPECQIKVWEASGGKEVATLQGFGGKVKSLAFAGGSNLLVTGMDDSTVLIWDLKTLARKGA